MAPSGIDADIIQGANGPAAIAEAEKSFMLTGWNQN